MALRFAVGYGQCCQSKFPKFPAADCQKSGSISKKKKKRSWIFTTVLTSSDLLKSRFATQLSCIFLLSFYTEKFSGLDVFPQLETMFAI